MKKLKLPTSEQKIETNAAMPNPKINSKNKSPY
jgi:hypothetical protein